MPEDPDALEDLLLMFSPRLQRILAQGLQGWRQGRGIPHAAFWAQALVEDDAAARDASAGDAAE